MCQHACCCLYKAYAHCVPCTKESEHAPFITPNTHSHTRMHRLTAITVTIRLDHALIHIHTYMHCLTAITVTIRLVQSKNTLQNTHASPRRNHSDHTPREKQNTHSHTCMHRLAAINVTACALHKPKHILPHTHACIASQQSP